MQAPVFLCVSANANFSFPDHSRPQKAEKTRGQYGERLWGAAAFCLLFSFPICILPIYAVSLQWQKEHAGAPFLCPESPHSSQGDFPPYFAGCHPARMAVHKRPFWPFIRPKRTSKCGRPAKSFGLGGKPNGPDGENKADGKARKGEYGKTPCKAFSKDLIACAIPPKKRSPHPLKGALPSNCLQGCKPPLGGWGISVGVWVCVFFTQSPPVRPLRARPVPASRRWQSPCRSFRPRCCFASSWPQAPPRCRRHSPRRPRPR